MNAVCSERAIISQLRERCDQLEEENRQLRAALTPPRPLRLGVHLTPGEDRLLRTLLARAPNVVTREGLLLATRGCQRSGDDEACAIKTVDVWIFKIRRKLPEGVSIALHWGVGYSLDRESAARLRAIDEAAR